jgi:hypothetical protein
MMGREELLKKLQLKDDELKHLLHHFGRFLDALENDAERKVVKRSLPTLCEARVWLGSGATEAELRELFGGSYYADGEPIMVCYFAGGDRA